MCAVYERLEKALSHVRKVTDFIPRVALVLGTGLGAYARRMQVVAEISYRDIPGFPVSTVEGHKGRFLLGWLKDVPVVLMEGRVHYYEGYTMEEVVLPIRLMGRMGAGILLLTNASGGIREDLQPGDFLLIRDHISSFVPSPLRGENPEELGPRFPDMTQVYDVALQEEIQEAAQKEGIPLKEGVYLQTAGPQFETPAEIRMYALAGAEVVGMSTACEAIAARHMGMRVCGISFVSNLASGLGPGELSHLEVEEVARGKALQLEKLVDAAVARLGAQKEGEERGI